jgi:pSer/pThr/pTyr-binding forkhead associated (FHA) protein
MKVRLSVQHKKANVKSVVLHTDALIGRSTECNLRLASGLVSRRHCKLLISDEQVAVIDLGSSNGTFLNEDKITPKVEVPIPAGSELTIGPARFIVQYDDPTAETHIRRGASAASESEAEEPVAGTRLTPEETPTADALPVHSGSSTDSPESDSPATAESEEGDLEISDEELEALLAEEGFESEDSEEIHMPLEHDSEAGPESETIPYNLAEMERSEEKFPPESAEGEASGTEPDEATDDDEEDVMKFLQDME